MPPLIQPRLEPTPAGTDLTGKTALVTGASAGIGLETCRQLLSLNVTKLCMAVRNVPKGEAVRETLLSDPEIRGKALHPNVQVLKLDMDDYDSVQQFAATVRSTVPTLDILILNAGMGASKYETSPSSGHERVLQVNYLSNALLVFELLPLLNSSTEKSGSGSSPSRITWVGSRMHRRATFPKRPLPADRSILGTMDDPAHFSLVDQYSDTKLLALMFMQDVAARVPQDKVLFNMLCPGMVATNIADGMPWLMRTLTNVMWWLRARTAEQGAWTVVNAAAVAGGESHGEFLGDKTIME